MLLVRLTDADQAPSLCAFIQSVSGLARRTSDPNVVEIRLPGAESLDREQREVANYLATWRELRGGCEAEIVRRSPPA